METILITGGAGFIGSHVSKRLLETCRVIVLDTLDRNALAHFPHRQHPNLKLVQGDVRDMTLLKKLVEPCSRILHLAATAGVQNVAADSVGTMRTIWLGTEAVLQAVSGQPNLKRVVILSSGEVYGAWAERQTESDLRIHMSLEPSRWGYGVSKLAAEMLALSYHREKGLPTCCVRPYNVYGPGQVGESAVSSFCSQALSGKPLFLVNGGTQVRAWCYIDDFIDGLWHTLFDPEAVGQVFNLGNPNEPVTVQRLAELILRLADSRSKLEDSNTQAPQVALRIPNIQKAIECFGFRPQVDLKDGLSRTLAWFEDRGDRESHLRIQQEKTCTEHH